MARGRMVSISICMDKRIANLSDDTSRLSFTWLITHADCEGRTYGDPAMVRSMLFPRRSDRSSPTVDRIASYLQEWHNAGLIVWYEANGDRFVWFPGFEKNQVGLRKDREAPSIIPAPSCGITPEQLQSNSGVTPAECNTIEYKLNRIEDNGIQDGDSSSPKPLTTQQDMFGALAEVCQLNPALQKTQLGKTASQLIKAGYTPDQIRERYNPGAWWYLHDWRGQKGQPPTLPQVVSTIEQAGNNKVAEPKGFAGIRAFLEESSGN